MTADVAELKTRAGHTEGALTTGSMGLYFATTGVTGDSYNADNREVKYESGSWKIQGEKLLWKNGTTNVNYKAYHPYSTDVTNGSVTVTATTDQTSEPVTDFLYASGTATGNTSAGSIPINFEHQMAKLTINLSGKANTDFATTFPTIASVTISGSKLTNTFSVTNENWGTATGDATDIKMDDIDSYSFEAILIPQEIAANNFVVTIKTDDNRTFIYKHTSAITFGKNQAYTLALEIGKTSAEINSVQVKSWSDATTIDPAGDVDEKEPNYRLIETTYHVYNADGLEEMNAHITENSNWSYNITLEPTSGSEFNMSGKSWTPISGSSGYTGTFEGNGHTISNLTTNGEDAGLIGSTNGTVQNLTLKNPTITGTSDATGGIAGSIGKGATISNCKVIGGEIKSSGMQVGGIVGRFSYGTIIGCTVSGTEIKGTTHWVGGIAGKVSNSSCNIIACHVTGAKITGTERTTGGIAGEISYETITGCFVYKCTPNNIVGTNSSNKGTACYYTTDGNTITSSDGSAVADWNAAMGAMNGAITTALAGTDYTCTWDGAVNASVDNAIVTVTVTDADAIGN